MEPHKKFSSSKSPSLPFSPKVEPAKLPVIYLGTNMLKLSWVSQAFRTFLQQRTGEDAWTWPWQQGHPRLQKTLNTHTAYSAGLSCPWEAWMSHGEHSLEVMLPQSYNVGWFGGAKMLTHPLGPDGHEAKVCGNSSCISAKHCPARNLPQGFLLLTNDCFLMKCCFVRKCSSTPFSFCLLKFQSFYTFLEGPA